MVEGLSLKDAVKRLNGEDMAPTLPLAARLSVRERRFLDKYLLNGGEREQAAIEAGYEPHSAYRSGTAVLSRQLAKDYIAQHQVRAAAQTGFTFEKKLNKLQHIVTLAVPDNASDIKDTLPSAEIQAIAEANKMQGHYSAEKVQQTNVNLNVELGRLDEIMKRYEKEY
jgi:phage terminase small subunit